MKIIKVKDYQEMSRTAAQLVIDQINKNLKSVLGLATGGTPEGLYEILKNHKDTSWHNIKVFNLDEYVGLPPGHSLSYKEYMKKQLFNSVNIQGINTNIPKNEGDIDQNGKDYDRDIEKAGGIDLQILGIGENAHIAFNEPGSNPEAGTRKVQLTESTINANSRYFKSKNDVPKFAISMGIGTIMKAKKIILLASGKNKAQAIAQTINGIISPDIPSSYLQNHKDVTLIIDKEASGKI